MKYITNKKKRRIRNKRLSSVREVTKLPTINEEIPVSEVIEVSPDSSSKGVMDTVPFEIIDTKVEITTNVVIDLQENLPNIFASDEFQELDLNELFEEEIVGILQELKSDNQFDDQSIGENTQEYQESHELQCEIIAENDTIVEKQMEYELKHLLSNTENSIILDKINSKINRDIDLFSKYLVVVNHDYMDDNQTITNFENDEGIYESLLIVRDILVGETRSPLVPTSINEPMTSLIAAKELVNLAQQQYDKTVEDIKINPSKLAEIDSEIITIAETVLTNAQNILTYVKNVEMDKKSVTIFVNKLNDWYMSKLCNVKPFNEFKNLFANDICVKIYVKSLPVESEYSPPAKGLFWTLIGNVNRAVLMDLFRALIDQNGRYITPPFSTSIPYNTITYKKNLNTLGGRYSFDIILTTDSKNKITGIILRQSPFVS